MKSKIVLLLGSLLVALSLFSQQEKRQQISAWLKVTANQTETEVEVWCENLSALEHTLQYELKVSRSDPNGNISSNTQGGEFVIMPKTKKIISATSVNRKKADYFLARLKVLDGKRLVASDHYISGTPPDVSKESIDRELYEEKTLSEEDLSGGVLLIDNTRTRAGHQFYELFYAAWEAPEGSENMVVNVEELPFRGLITMIKIKMDEIEVFSQHIQPQSRHLNELAPVAAHLVRLRMEMIIALNRDLEEIDRKGTGIY